MRLVTRCLYLVYLYVPGGVEIYPLDRDGPRAVKYSNLLISHNFQAGYSVYLITKLLISSNSSYLGRFVLHRFFEMLKTAGIMKGPKQVRKHRDNLA